MNIKVRPVCPYCMIEAQDVGFVEIEQLGDGGAPVTLKTRGFKIFCCEYCHKEYAVDAGCALIFDSYEIAKPIEPRPF